MTAKVSTGKNLEPIDEIDRTIHAPTRLKNPGLFGCRGPGRLYIFTQSNRIDPWQFVG